jgi:hypothetical protein
MFLREVIREVLLPHEDRELEDVSVEELRVCFWVRLWLVAAALGNEVALAAVSAGPSSSERVSSRDWKAMSWC